MTARSGERPIRQLFTIVPQDSKIQGRWQVVRLEGGNTSNVKRIGGGIHEIKIDFGPGYRLYFGLDGSEIVILLAGGTKKRQDKDIETAQKRWAGFKARKKKET